MFILYPALWRRNFIPYISKHHDDMELTDTRSESINPALKELGILIGEWEIFGRHRLIPDPITGRMSISWLNGESFLVMRMDFNHSGPPDSTGIIGSDDAAGKLSMLYYDERGVSRIYDVSFRENVLTMERIFPGFSQKYRGSIINDGSKIEGVWELRESDDIWKIDVEVTYTKIFHKPD